ncbi:hypothetical protein PPYR_01587 [Photinus pyralis]|uniref:Peptidase aspartic putative domain-containing protein n=1 Tax=Photinus pyralis TaxID=7054 RepID=A0A5N4B4S6_PHOPY|nr:hypothetical protein PPYR_01587 [Photinus pyralis]
MPNKKEQLSVSSLELSATLIEDLQRLKNKRSYLKKQLTILQNYLDEPDSDSCKNKVQKQFEVCERAIDSFESFLESIFDADHDDLFDEFFSEKSETDTFFGVLKTKVISKFGKDNPSTITDTSPIERKLARLPRINLTSFSGKYEEWLSFRDSFHSLIDSNKSLTTIEKFQYLKGAVIGEAAAVIKCLETSEANYDQAKDLLKSRYENKRVIISNHIKAIFELPVVTRESHDNFRNMFDSILQHTRALKAMGRPVEGYDDFLIYLITSKFPFSTRKEWEDKDYIRSYLPTNLFNKINVNLPQNTFLADPDYNMGGEIDLLIGAEIFYGLLLDGIIHAQPKGLILKETVFSWIISGSISAPRPNKLASCNLTTLQELNEKISAFWEVERVPNIQIRSFEEQRCETHFQKTITRDSSGRFVASLPWTTNPKLLGHSLEIAKKRFLNLERRLLNHNEEKLEYDKFLYHVNMTSFIGGSTSST